MNLYLVRHGVTAWNRSGRLQGWAANPLLLEGVVQARQTAAFLAAYRAARGLPFAALYSSPLRRTWQTATILSERLGLLPSPHADLREMHCGQAQGLPASEWRARYPDLETARCAANDRTFGWPGGETRQAFYTRCRQAISAIVARHAADDHVLVVTHGGVIHAYLSEAGLHDPAAPRRYDADNCSITQVLFAALSGTPTGYLVAFNHTAHLQENAPVPAPGSRVPSQGPPRIW
ncbi:MAG: histidine phosphatase family protein [Chloroflexota bacterium]|nr:histidine phosphatase family protein [Chloroflexota bacterium]